MFATALTALAGCEPGEPTLDLQDLTPAERRFVTRFVVLERARAVAMADPDRGEALLDSLAAAWGDTAAAVARQSVPADPHRAGALYDLLRRVLEAEQDSLVFSPDPDRLDAPLPRPLPPAAGEQD
ncbi:MAG: hypothetical protein R6X25_05630 [Candidatus Krumholzibacteriia bacterium]